MCHRVVCEPSSLLFSIKDTETVNVRPKNFLPSQVNKGQTLNHQKKKKKIWGPDLTPDQNMGQKRGAAQLTSP